MNMLNRSQRQTKRHVRATRASDAERTKKSRHGIERRIDKLGVLLGVPQLSRPKKTRKALDFIRRELHWVPHAGESGFMPAPVRSLNPLNRNPYDQAGYRHRLYWPIDQIGILLRVRQPERPQILDVAIHFIRSRLSHLAPHVSQTKPAVTVQRRSKQIMLEENLVPLDSLRKAATQLSRLICPLNR